MDRLPPPDLYHKEDVMRDNTDSVKTETDVSYNDTLQMLGELIEKVRNKELCVDRSIVLDFSKLIEDAVYNGVKRALNE